jgi:hypothetical protein
VSLPTAEPAAVAAFWAVARPALGLSGYRSHDRGLAPTMPVVLQSFEVIFAG